VLCVVCCVLCVVCCVLCVVCCVLCVVCCVLCALSFMFCVWAAPQVTLAVVVCSWAHVRHAQYTPWGDRSQTYIVQHLALFVTSFVFLMGLLFKVRGGRPLPGVCMHVRARVRERTERPTTPQRPLQDCPEPNPLPPSCVCR
jgi:hypothetical protein